MSELEILTDTDRGVSRRTFIKGVIAAGATASSAAYLFRASGGAAAPSAQNAVGRMVTLNVNGQQRRVDVHPNETLGLTLRYKLGLTGTKFGCGINQCGACTVHLDGQAVRSCQVTVSSASGSEVTTIEGLSEDRSHPVQRAWIAEDVPQCGYCQSGQIMSAAALLERNPDPSDEEIEGAMGGNICRCGTYSRIRKAVHRAAGHAEGEG